MALTEDEKREARATDERAAAIIDRVDSMPPELLERLHGAVRYLKGVEGASRCEEEPELVPWWDPGADRTVSPETDGVVVAGVEVTKGSRVRLRPGQRRADAQDMFLAGRVATRRGGVPRRRRQPPPGRHPRRRPGGRPAALARPLPVLLARRGRAAMSLRPSPGQGAGRRRRQRLPGRRRLRGRGGQAAGHASPCPTGSGSATSASGASTWPTSCWTATRRRSWSTPRPAGRPRARST